MPVSQVAKVTSHERVKIVVYWVDYTGVKFVAKYRHQPRLHR